MDLTGRTDYSANYAKASQIKNLVFRYLEKALAFTLFFHGDSIGVGSQWELYFLYCMENNDLINVASFAAYHLHPVSKSSTCEILVGCMITLIAEHYDYTFHAESDIVVQGKQKVDMESLVHQGMIH